jgi:rod shape-determining protein MreC
MVMNVQALGSLYEENKHLRREVSRLKQWESVARHIEVENAQMRDLLRFRRDDPIRVITGRIVGMGGTFVRSLTLNRGMNDGVQKGQVAVTGDGLIGRVAETGQYSSRILLVTDLNSRVPVLVENSLARAILAGDNTALPRLIYGAANSDIQPGQRVVTSGDAGVFPPGLPVGQIVSANENGVRVHLFAANERPELVRLMDFGKTGILGTGIQNAEKLR